MNIPQLQIHQQPAQIGINIKKHDVVQHNAEARLEVEQKLGDLNIESDTGRVDIDSYPAQYDMGFKKFTDAARDYAQAGRQAALEYIGREARNGDRLMKIEEGITVVDIIRDEFSPGEKSLSLKWKRGPEINVKKDELLVDYDLQRPSTNAEFSPFQLDFEWGEVNVYLQQKDYIDIEVKGSNLDKQV